MKKLRSLPIAAIIAATVFLSSCSYNPNSNPPPGPTAKMNFQKDFHANYDIFIVDTADKNGNNGYHTGRHRRACSEIIVTNITYPDLKSKTSVALIVTYDGFPTPNDTNYFYQDPNGDLYRYNFGFSILNQFLLDTGNR